MTKQDLLTRRAEIVATLERCERAKGSPPETIYVQGGRFKVASRAECAANFCRYALRRIDAQLNAQA